MREVDALGERAGGIGLEADRVAVRADVSATVSTARTGAIADAEGDSNSIADGDRLDSIADLDYAAGRLVAEDLSERDAIVGPLTVALPGVPVAATDPAGFDSNDNSVGSWCRVRDRSAR